MKKNLKLFEIRESKICGLGVFAIKDFSKDEYISSLGNKVISVVDPFTMDSELYKHAFPIGKDKNQFTYIVSSPAIHLNHSCTPNAGIRNNNELIAIKKINKGEEIVVDYAMCNIDGFEMACKCGNIKCRKRVVPFFELDGETQKQYFPYCIGYIKDKYLSSIDKYNQERSSDFYFRQQFPDEIE